MGAPQQVPASTRLLQVKLRESAPLPYLHLLILGTGKCGNTKDTQQVTSIDFPRAAAQRKHAAAASQGRLFHRDYLVGRPGVIYDFLSLMREQRGSCGPSRL